MYNSEFSNLFKTLISYDFDKPFIIKNKNITIIYNHHEFYTVTVDFNNLEYKKLIYEILKEDYIDDVDFYCEELKCIIHSNNKDDINKNILKLIETNMLPENIIDNFRVIWGINTEDIENYPLCFITYYSNCFENYKLNYEKLYKLLDIIMIENNDVFDSLKIKIEEFILLKI